MQLVAPSAGKPLTFSVWAHGTQRTVTITPQARTDTNPANGAVRVIGQIGAARRLERHPLSLDRALGNAWRGTWRSAGLVVLTIRELATKSSAWHSLSGPVGIWKYSVDTARSGFADLLSLIAILSINVALFNLLPIPILDGGQVVVNVAEAVKGRPFSAQTREAILRIGLITIAALFLLVMYNDRCQLVSALCSAR